MGSEKREDILKRLVSHLLYIKTEILGSNISEIFSLYLDLLSEKIIKHFSHNEVRVYLVRDNTFNSEFLPLMLYYITSLRFLKKINIHPSVLPPFDVNPDIYLQTNIPPILLYSRDNEYSLRNASIEEMSLLSAVEIYLQTFFLTMNTKRCGLFGNTSLLSLFSSIKPETIAVCEEIVKGRQSDKNDVCYEINRVAEYKLATALNCLIENNIPFILFARPSEDIKNVLEQHVRADYEFPSKFVLDLLTNFRVPKGTTIVLIVTDYVTLNAEVTKNAQPLNIYLSPEDIDVLIHRFKLPPQIKGLLVSRRNPLFVSYILSRRENVLELLSKQISQIPQLIPVHEEAKPLSDIVLTPSLRKFVEANIVKPVMFGYDPPHSIIVLRPRGCGGKTLLMSIAREILSPPFLLDTSQLRSKYYGETGKNVMNIYNTLKGTGATLIMPEIENEIFAKETSSLQEEKEDTLLQSLLLRMIEDTKRGFIIASTISSTPEGLDDYLLDSGHLGAVRIPIHFPTSDIGAKLLYMFIQENIEKLRERGIEITLNLDTEVLRRIYDNYILIASVLELRSIADFTIRSMINRHAREITDSDVIQATYNSPPNYSEHYRFLVKFKTYIEKFNPPFPLKIEILKIHNEHMKKIDKIKERVERIKILGMV